jgi:two-component sensor histidine kinase
MNTKTGRPAPTSEPHASKPDGIDRAAADTGMPFFPDLELLAHALGAANIGVWAWDLASNKITWSQNLEAMHGRPPGTFDGSFAGFEEDIHPDDRAMVRTAIQEALDRRRPYSVVYRLPAKPGEDQRWLSASGKVLVDGDAPQTLFGVCRDVTAWMRSEDELRMRAQRQDVVAQLGARALTDEDLQRFLDDMAMMVATMLDVDLVNILELAPGDGELLFRAGYGWKPDVVNIGALPIARGSQAEYTIAALGPVLAPDLRAETRFTPAPVLLDHGVASTMSTTIVGQDRRKYGIFGVHTRRQRTFSEYDMALLASVANIIAGAIQRRQSDQRQKMMIRELHHRSGNLFSQLLALLSQTASTSKSVGELVTRYQARVFALANATRLMVEGGWQPASVLDLLRAQLAPVLDRVTLTGPNVYVEPALAFAISSVAHELVSNAIKHGSLSVLRGKVEVTWSVDRTPHSMTLLLDWQERNGPAPKRPQRSRFGSRLINTVVKRQMNGKVQRTFASGGLRCRLTIPLTHERWPEAAVLG